jgi:hypothetical protein
MTQFPAWVYEYQQRPLLLVRPSTIWAIEQLNLAPPNPWAYNSSRADKIFLETEEDRHLFLINGASHEQLVVVGAPYMDKIDELKKAREEIKKTLCREYKYDLKKPFVVASVTPNKVAQRNVELEFRSYRDLIDKWSTALASHLDCNLIYSLHPLTKYEDVSFIEKKGGNILRRPLEELIVIADLFVVDCSGTTRWARYAGVEVIDYDFYKYNLCFNSKLDGVCHITDYSDFLLALSKANEKFTDRKPQTQGPIQRRAANFNERFCLELEKMILEKKFGDVI